MEKSTKDLLQFSILNIDKPSGPTSFDVSDFVRKKLRELGVGKTSHFGTLDPKVTGVLPIALGRACKLTGFFLGHDKEYVGVMRVHKEISIDKLQETINKKFLGKIKQTPPLKSRVKRQEREREIISFEILEQGEGQNSKDFLFRTKVQGGTYIRKLIDDLGKELGIGAHMLELRRTQAGIFSEDDNEFVNLYEFEKIVDKISNKLINEKSKKEVINNPIKPMSKVDNHINSDKIITNKVSSKLRVGNSKSLGGVENLEIEKELRKILIPAEEAIKKVFPVVELKEEKEIKKLWTGKPLFKEAIVSENNKLVSKKDIINKQLKKEVINKRVGSIGKVLEGGVELNEGDKFALFFKKKFIGIYKKTNEKDILARPEFVFQPIKQL